MALWALLIFCFQHATFANSFTPVILSKANIISVNTDNVIATSITDSTYVFLLYLCVCTNHIKLKDIILSTRQAHVIVIVASIKSIFKIYFAACFEYNSSSSHYLGWL